MAIRAYSCFMLYAYILISLLSRRCCRRFCRCAVTIEVYNQPTLYVSLAGMYGSRHLNIYWKWLFYSQGLLNLEWLHGKPYPSSCHQLLETIVYIGSLRKPKETDTVNRFLILFT